jgi:2-keto-4-pentenoate hydratase/2-oxohepta-3-ene-1,7-dioic acid hydratase in catechol pathway
MRVCRYNTPDGQTRLGLWARRKNSDGELGPRLIYPYLREWTGQELLRGEIGLQDLLDTPTGEPFLEDPPLQLPILDETPVWALAVNYFRSCMIRSMHSPFKACYDQAFNSDLPPMFLKGAGLFASGDGQPITPCSGESKVWPGPTLALIFNARLDLLGYVLANDLLIPWLESENPLRLGMSRVFHGNLGMGSAMKIADRPDMGPWKIKLRIRRGDKNVFQGETDTGKMRWSVADLRPFLESWGPFPDGVAILTGTEAVFTEEFSLEPGDRIRIRSRGLGRFDQTVEKKS